MQKKILIQIFLLLTVIIILIFFYNIYFVDNRSETQTTVIENKIPDSDVEKSNTLHDVEYFAEDFDGGQYIIKSKFGEIKDNQPNLIFLKEVKAIILLKDSASINILSEGATYNSLSYNTNFYGNVLTTYTDHSILSDNMDLDFKKNLAFISNEVKYKNLNTSLQADKVEIDLISKNLKIFMNDNSKTIKIINKE